MSEDLRARDALVRIIADKVPVDPDDRTTPIYWRPGQDAEGEYYIPTWGAPETVAGPIADAVLAETTRREIVLTWLLAEARWHLTGAQPGEDYAGPDCANPTCPCRRPGHPCEAWEGDDTSPWCPHCGWAERHHVASTETSKEDDR